MVSQKMVQGAKQVDLAGVTSHNCTIVVCDGRRDVVRAAQPLPMEKPGGWYGVGAAATTGERFAEIAATGGLPGGDTARDRALHFGCRLCGRHLAELMAVVALRNCGVVATNALCYAGR